MALAVAEMWGMSVGEVLDLPSSEVMLGAAYISWKNGKEKEAMAKARAKGKVKNKPKKSSFNQ